jgi:hypothetical protein
VKCRVQTASSKTNHAYFSGTVDAQLGDGPHQSQQLIVVAGDNGGGARVQAQQLHAKAIAGLDLAIPGAQVRFAEGKAVRFHGLAETLQAARVRRKSQAAGDEDDACVTEPDDVIGGGGAGGNVVGGNGVVHQPAWNPIDEDDGKAAAHKVFIGGRGVGTGDEHSIDAAGEQGIEVMQLFPGFLGRIAKNHGVAVLSGGIRADLTFSYPRR